MLHPSKDYRLDAGTPVNDSVFRNYSPLEHVPKDIQVTLNL